MEGMPPRKALSLQYICFLGFTPPPPSQPHLLLFSVGFGRMGKNPCFQDEGILINKIIIFKIPFESTRDICIGSLDPKSIATRKKTATLGSSLQFMICYIQNYSMYSLTDCNVLFVRKYIRVCKTTDLKLMYLIVTLPAYKAFRLLPLHQDYINFNITTSNKVSCIYTRVYFITTAKLWPCLI